MPEANMSANAELCLGPTDSVFFTSQSLFEGLICIDELILRLLPIYLSSLRNIPLLILELTDVSSFIGLSPTPGITPDDCSMR